MYRFRIVSKISLVFKFGFGKQFLRPFSLFSATQILMAERLVSPLLLCVFCLFFHLGDFRFHGFDQLCELFLAFLSCLGVAVFFVAYDESAFIFANLCKLLIQKWSVTHLGQTTLGSCFSRREPFL